LNMSFKTTNEILGHFTLWPRNFTLDNYAKIFTDPTWYRGYINSLIYVLINTALSVSVALPAAYAFSRYRFLGDKHLFFWLLSNRMASRGFRAPLPSALFGRRALRYAHRCRTRPYIVQHSLGGMDSRGIHVGGAEGTG
jgi:ABC-type uncharacterized transport system permease subunit